MAGETVSCDYCGAVAPLTTGLELYPHRPDLSEKQFYACMPCGAWVGCHPGTTKPLGRLADGELRRAKMAAHAAFDPIWKGGHMKRGKAYGWLAGKLGIAKDDCHIGMFDIATCRRVAAICTEWRLS